MKDAIFLPENIALFSDLLNTGSKSKKNFLMHEIHSMLEIIFNKDEWLALQKKLQFTADEIRSIEQSMSAVKLVVNNNDEEKIIAEVLSARKLEQRKRIIFFVEKEVGAIGFIEKIDEKESEQFRSKVDTLIDNFDRFGGKGAFKFLLEVLVGDLGELVFRHWFSGSYIQQIFDDVANSDEMKKRFILLIEKYFLEKMSSYDENNFGVISFIFNRWITGVSITKDKKLGDYLKKMLNKQLSLLQEDTGLDNLDKDHIVEFIRLKKEEIKQSDRSIYEKKHLYAILAKLDRIAMDKQRKEIILKLRSIEINIEASINDLIEMFEPVLKKMIRGDFELRKDFIFQIRSFMIVSFKEKIKMELRGRFEEPIDENLIQNLLDIDKKINNKEKMFETWRREIIKLLFNRIQVVLVVEQMQAKSSFRDNWLKQVRWLLNEVGFNTQISDNEIIQKVKFLSQNISSNKVT